MNKFSNILPWIHSPETVSIAIQNGIGSSEEFQEAMSHCDTFRTELDREWTCERIRDFLVEKKREAYKDTAILVNKLELQNRDARVKGVSFKERKTFIEKIATGHRLAIDIQKEVHQIKRGQYKASTMVSPIDYPVIQEQGFDKYLEMYHV